MIIMPKMKLTSAAVLAATIFSVMGAQAASNIAAPVRKNVTYIQPEINNTQVVDENAEEVVVDDTTTKNEVDDFSTGEVVVGNNKNVDDSAIKSIESRDGKKYTTLNLSAYAKAVNEAVWSPNMKVNTAMTVKLQVLLDWNHSSPGPIDGGWGANSVKALKNFQAIKGIPVTGKMNQATWDALVKNIPASQPVLVSYKLTTSDVKGGFAPIPSGSEAKSKMKSLNYENIYEMLGERFHMDVAYVHKLNNGKAFRVGDEITVINTGKQLNERITRVVADKASKTLYAYNGNRLIATYPTTVGSDGTPTPHGTYRVVNKVKMPWYKATIDNGGSKQVFMLPPGPNNPVGVVWLGLSRPSYGIHGSPLPEGISRQASHGCVRLTNWDALEVYANIDSGASVEIR